MTDAASADAPYIALTVEQKPRVIMSLEKEDGEAFDLNSVAAALDESVQQRTMFGMTSSQQLFSKAEESAAMNNHSAEIQQQLLLNMSTTKSSSTAADQQEITNADAASNKKLHLQQRKLSSSASRITEITVVRRGINCMERDNATARASSSISDKPPAALQQQQLQPPCSTAVDETDKKDPVQLPPPPLDYVDHEENLPELSPTVARGWCYEDLAVQVAALSGPNAERKNYFLSGASSSVQEAIIRRDGEQDPVVDDESIAVVASAVDPVDEKALSADGNLVENKTLSEDPVEKISAGFDAVPTVEDNGTKKEDPVEESAAMEEDPVEEKISAMEEDASKTVVDLTNSDSIFAAAFAEADIAIVGEPDFATPSTALIRQRVDDSSSFQRVLESNCGDSVDGSSVASLGKLLDSLPDVSTQTMLMTAAVAGPKDQDVLVEPEQTEQQDSEKLGVRQEGNEASVKTTDKPNPQQVVAQIKGNAASATDRPHHLQVGSQTKVRLASASSTGNPNPLQFAEMPKKRKAFGASTDNPNRNATPKKGTKRKIFASKGAKKGKALTLTVKTKTSQRAVARRSGFASRNLMELQEATKEWYMAQQQATQASSVAPISLFTLHFNEGTVGTVARWVAGGPLRKRIPFIDRPTVDTRYRCCSSCFMYGHYEAECLKLSRSQVIKLSRALACQSSPFGLEDDLKYDATAEICEGYLIEQRATPEGEAVQSRITVDGPDGTPGDDSDDVMELDGFLIKVGASADSFSRLVLLDEGPSHPTTDMDVELKTIEKGSFVAWFLETSNNGDDSAANRDVCIGIVKEFDSGKVLIKVLRTIEPDRGLQSQGPPEGKVGKKRLRRPPSDSLVWIPHDRLHLVVERNSVVSQAALKGKRRRIPSWKRPSMMSNTKRYKGTGRINSEDLSMRPTHQARQGMDGTFIRPKGRNPSKYSEAQRGASPYIRRYAHQRANRFQL